MRTALALSTVFVFSLAPHAMATASVAIDLSHQRMHVDSSSGSYDWPISSARSGFYTPGGSFAPTHLELMHYSHKYHMSPMPYAIFFRGGYAIHGTYSKSSLGHPASHGCVRLSPGHAAALYSMVKAEGARISISGTPPSSRPFYARSERRSYAYAGAEPARYRARAKQRSYGYGGAPTYSDDSFFPDSYSPSSYRAPTDEF